jgi:hypothetical protein
VRTVPASYLGGILFEYEGVLSVVNDIYVCFQLAYTIFNDAVTSSENT